MFGPVSIVFGFSGFGATALGLVSLPPENTTTPTPARIATSIPMPTAVTTRVRRWRRASARVRTSGSAMRRRAYRSSGPRSAGEPGPSGRGAAAGRGLVEQLLERLDLEEEQAE